MNYKLWIARDEGTYEDDERVSGALHIFYDSPLLLQDISKNIKTWQNARVLCEVPSYMFPEIKEKTCALFKLQPIKEDWY